MTSWQLFRDDGKRNAFELFWHDIFKESKHHIWTSMYPEESILFPKTILFSSPKTTFLLQSLLKLPNNTEKKSENYTIPLNSTRHLYADAKLVCYLRTTIWNRLLEKLVPYHGMEKLFCSTWLWEVYRERRITSLSIGEGELPSCVLCWLVWIIEEFWTGSLPNSIISEGHEQFFQVCR